MQPESCVAGTGVWSLPGCRGKFDVSLMEIELAPGGGKALLQDPTGLT